MGVVRGRGEVRVSAMREVKKNVVSNFLRRLPATWPDPPELSDKPGDFAGTTG
jgi:hypothetical protein